MDAALLKLARDDPNKLDELEASVQTLIKKAEEHKKNPTKSAIESRAESLQKQLKDLEDMQKSLRDDEERLKQLTCAGDERSILNFFEEKGLSEDQIRQGLSGDVDGALANVANQISLDDNVESTLALADNLSATLNSDKEHMKDIPPLAEPKQMPPKKKLVLQPDFFQRKPTSQDPNIVVTIMLPKINDPSTVDLDVDDGHLRLRAPIPDSQDSSYMLNIPLSRPVLPSGTAAKWKPKQSSLVVTLPLRGSSSTSLKRKTSSNTKSSE